MAKHKITLPPYRQNKRSNLIMQSKVSQFIYQLGESKILSQKSKPVDPEKIAKVSFQEKLSYLKNCFKKYRKITGLGRGIAAPQVGISLSFFVVLIDEKLETFINPTILKFSPKKFLYSELCMSGYPVIAPVIRPSWIEFEYLNENGEKKIWNTKDQTKKGKIYNRIFEHEIDHLNGIINIQKATSLSDLSFDASPKFYKSAKFKKV